MVDEQPNETICTAQPTRVIISANIYFIVKQHCDLGEEHTASYTVVNGSNQNSRLNLNYPLSLYKIQIE